MRQELLLVCTRGSCMPDVPTLIDSVVQVERGAHSEKPERFREIIDTLYPHGARCEIFARKTVPPWVPWGTKWLDEYIGAELRDECRGFALRCPATVATCLRWGPDPDPRAFLK